MEPCQIELFKDVTRLDRLTTSLLDFTNYGRSAPNTPQYSGVRVQNAMRVQPGGRVRVKKKRRWFILPISIQRPAIKKWKGCNDDGDDDDDDDKNDGV